MTIIKRTEEYENARARFTAALDARHRQKDDQDWDIHDVQANILALYSHVTELNRKTNAHPTDHLTILTIAADIALTTLYALVSLHAIDTAPPLPPMHPPADSQPPRTPSAACGPARTIPLNKRSHAL